MSLQRFALYFLSISACAVVLFPCMVPSVPPPAPQFANPFNYPTPPPVLVRMTGLRKCSLHHHHLAPATIVASN